MDSINEQLNSCGIYLNDMSKAGLQLANALNGIAQYVIEQEARINALTEALENERIARIRAEKKGG